MAFGSWLHRFECRSLHRLDCNIILAHSNNPMSKLLHHQTHRNSNPEAEWVMFIHGAGGGTATWKKQIRDFGRHFHLVLVDLPGHAKSSQSCTEIPKYSFEFIAEKTWQIADHLEIKKIHLVSVSLGSIVSMVMKEQQPERIKSMVFAGPITSLDTKLRIVMKSGLMISGIIGFRNFYKLMAKIILPKKNHESARKVFVREANALTDAEYKKWTAMYGKHLDATLKRVFSMAPEVPIFLVVGTQDHFFLATTKKYAQLFPSNIELSIIENCGHLVSLEREEIFNQQSIDYIQTKK
jgi:pimeloyl-ACP methyl ester carboxylesterase